MILLTGGSFKMPLSEALAVSLIGIITVIIILAIIAVLINLVSNIIRTVESKASTSEKTPTPASSTVYPNKAEYQGQIELMGTDEKDAAVIMAIVSAQSGIPLSRLNFKSIREKKGETNND